MSVRGLKNVYKHPDYFENNDINDTDHYWNISDIALAELDSEFPEWSITLKPACLDIDRHTGREQLGRVATKSTRKKAKK